MTFRNVAAVLLCRVRRIPRVPAAFRRARGSARRLGIVSVSLMSVAAVSCLADLTTDQKIADFTALAGLYAKNYAPYEWKKTLFGFDALDLAPWLAQVQTTRNDLDYYDVCIRYVASLNDSHDEFTLNSDFAAYLPFVVDIYDGRVLIDVINRNILSPNQYPFTIGDELVSVDGVAAADLVQSFLPYAVNAHGNPATARRIAALTITTRYQSWYPFAVNVGPTAVIAVRDSDKTLSSYTVPWTVTGLPLISSGTVPGFTQHALPPRKAPKPSPVRRAAGAADGGRNPWGLWTGPAADLPAVATPPSLAPLQEWQTSMALPGALGYASFGQPAPVFDPPDGFVLRLGASAADQFTSGVFPAGPRTLGFIRIPTMLPGNQSVALAQFQSEIGWLAHHTDALVIDVMRNGGGDLCYTQQLLQSLLPAPFRGFAYDIRASWDWVTFFNSALRTALAWRAEPAVIGQYQTYIAAVQSAMATGGMTGPLPVCGPSFSDIPPATDPNGNIAAYTHPILVLVDGLTLSAAEAFAMVLQDEGRATIFGVRTDGGGGNPISRATTYADGATRVTRTFITRRSVVATPGFPPSPYIENTGVYPDIVADYMTRANLLANGRPFVEAFTAAVTMVKQ